MGVPMQDGVLRNTLHNAGLNFEVPEQAKPAEKSGGMFSLFRRSVPQETTESKDIKSHTIKLESDSPDKLKARLSSVAQGLQSTQTLISVKQDSMKHAFSKGAENRSAVVKEVQGLASVWQAEQKKLDHLISVAESNKEIKGNPDLKLLKEHQAAINKQFTQIQSELVTQEKANLKTLQDTVLKPFQQGGKAGGNLKKVFSSLGELARLERSVSDCIPNRDTKALLKTIAEERTKTEQAILKTLNADDRAVDAERRAEVEKGAAESNAFPAGNRLSKYWMQMLIGETVPIPPKLDLVLSERTRPEFNQRIIQAAFIKAENQERLSRGESLIDTSSEGDSSLANMMNDLSGKILEEMDIIVEQLTANMKDQPPASQVEGEESQEYVLSEKQQFKIDVKLDFQHASNLITRNAYGLDKQVFSDNLLTGIGSGIEPEGDALDSGTAGRQQKFDSAFLDTSIKEMPRANQQRARDLQREGYRPIPITPHIWRKAEWNAKDGNLNQDGEMLRSGAFRMSLAIPGERPVEAKIPLDLTMLGKMTPLQTRYVMTIIHLSAAERDERGIKETLMKAFQTAGGEVDPETGKLFFEQEECNMLFSDIIDKGLIDGLASEVENLFQTIDYETNRLFYQVSSPKTSLPLTPEKELREFLGELITPPRALRQLMVESPEVKSAMDSYLKQSKTLRDLNLVRVDTNRSPLNADLDLMQANMDLNQSIIDYYAIQKQKHVDFIDQWVMTPIKDLDRALNQLSAQITAPASEDMRVKVALSSLVAYGKTVQQGSMEGLTVIQDDVDNLMVLVDILKSALSDLSPKFEAEQAVCLNFISQVMSSKATGATPQVIAETMLQDVSDLARQPGNIFKTKFDRAVYKESSMDALASQYPEYSEEIEKIKLESRYETNASARPSILFQNPPTLKQQEWLEITTANGKPNGPFKSGTLQAELRILGKDKIYTTEPMHLDLGPLYNLQNLSKKQVDAVLELIVKSVDSGEYQQDSIDVKAAFAKWEKDDDLKALLTPKFAEALHEVAQGFVHQSSMAIGQVMLTFGGW